MRFVYEKLRRYRESRGWSLSRVAYEVTAALEAQGRRGKRAVAASTVARWERGITAPDAHHLAALADAFGVGVEAFFARK